MRDGIGPTVQIDGPTGSEPSISEFCEKRQEPSFPRVRGCGIAGWKSFPCGSKSIPGREEPVPRAADRLIQPVHCSQVVVSLGIHTGGGAGRHLAE